MRKLTRFFLQRNSAYLLNKPRRISRIGRKRTAYRKWLENFIKRELLDDQDVDRGDNKSDTKDKE